MTEEEHKAAALLLGMHYFKPTNTYMKWELISGKTVVQRLDADTLEPVSHDTIMERYNASEEKRVRLLNERR